MSGINKFSINKRNISFVKFFAGAAALLFFLTALNFFNSGVRNVFFKVSSPIQKFFWQAGNSTTLGLGSVLNAGNFFKENQNLKSENQKLLAQVSILQAIVLGNQAQSEVSTACQSDGFDLKMAGVVGVSQDNLTINKGLDDGIGIGMPVINGQKALLGKVSKVYKNFSEVMLISSKNSIINVKVLQQILETPAPTPDASAAPAPTVQPAKPMGDVEGVIKGQGGLNIFLDLVPIDSTISQNDVLITSALDGVFPKGLLVGEITKVEKNDQNPHQQAQVKPFFNINTDNLFVITNYKR